MSKGNLSTSRREIALLIDPTRTYDRRIVRGVADYVQVNDLDWSLYIEDDTSLGLSDKRPWIGDGIIANFDNRCVAEAVMKTGTPVVGFGGGYGYHNQNSDIPYVRTDNKAIAEIAANHLMDLGIKYFAYYSPPESKTNGWAKERLLAFREYVSKSGYPCEVYVAQYTAIQNRRKLLRELQSWIISLPSKVGIMASSDTYAMDLLRACKELMLSVPDQVAIVGVDNDDIICELSRPKLTSIEQGTYRVGYQATAILHALLLGNKIQKAKAVPPERLVERESTQILAIDDEDVVVALHYIRQHACDPIAVSDVLDVANLSRSTLESRFRDMLGRTMHAEIRRVQLEKAQTLLKTTSVPIKEIARRTGTSSVQYFTKLVRQATGQTPVQIRESHKQH